ncbi:TPA: hypothetical protein ACGBUC_000509 [Klebsiella variicola]|jgi:hypothetical protein|uniref:hypothetical protein n=1 Tax=Klebsiella pneumoniae complex TaxID=3390273 RepID=UPI001403949B|nr:MULTISPECIES: hypothetical protein [Klebsiella]MDI0465065.1 hypothetical protein [Klebsiella variicola]HBU7951911.1 hypothetical protein [Klebsiella pneumoniae]HBV6315219.1 hypothetical protein [Klebsiella pneumoniae]HBV7275537.1 hypothetical protein [Klebsiella pneumoniae]HBW6303601.1 hypothetical protein [Klebsiella pneumoniae]
MNRSPEYAQGAVAALREAKAASIKNAVAVGTLEGADIGRLMIQVALLTFDPLIAKYISMEVKSD